MNSLHFLPLIPHAHPRVHHGLTLQPHQSQSRSATFQHLGASVLLVLHSTSALSRTCESKANDVNITRPVCFRETTHRKSHASVIRALSNSSSPFNAAFSSANANCCFSSRFLVCLCDDLCSDCSDDCDEEDSEADCIVFEDNREDGRDGQAVQRVRYAW